MQAQRGSQSQWDGQCFFGTDALTKFPELGALVAATIAGWSMVEAHLGRMFGSLIGAKRPVTMSMYSAVRSFEVQRDIIKAASVELLPRRYAMLVSACLDVMLAASKTRHRFAHWVWGASTDPSLPALLLVDPRHFWSLHVAQVRHWNDRRGKNAIERVGPYTFKNTIPKLNLYDVWVYTQPSLIHEKERIDRSYRIAEALRQLVISDVARRREVYRWICSEHDIEAALTKVKSNWPKSRSQSRVNAARPRYVKISI